MTQLYELSQIRVDEVISYLHTGGVLISKPRVIKELKTRVQEQMKKDKMPAKDIQDYLSRIIAWQAAR